MSPISTEMKVIISASIFKSGPIRNWEFTEGNSHHHFWAYKFKPSSPHLPPLLHKNPSKTATLKNPLWLVQMADPKWTQVDPPDDGCIEAAKWAAGSQQPPLTYMNTSKRMDYENGLYYGTDLHSQLHRPRLRQGWSWVPSICLEAVWRSYGNHVQPTHRA